MTIHKSSRFTPEIENCMVHASTGKCNNENLNRSIGNLDNYREMHLHYVLVCCVAIEMNSEIKRNIRNRWISSFFEIAHLEFQNRLWINADHKNSVGDYSECVCSYFDDLDLENGYSYFIKNGIISELEYEIVKALHANFKEYIERTEKWNLSDKDILKDVDWINITNIGLKSWKELKKKTESIRDKELMTQLENKFLE